MRKLSSLILCVAFAISTNANAKSGAYHHSESVPLSSIPALVFGNLVIWIKTRAQSVGHRVEHMHKSAERDGAYGVRTT
jgi:hypothetical protein